MTRPARPVVALLAPLLVAGGCGQPPTVHEDPGCPDGLPADAEGPGVPPEVDGRLVINELMAKNVLTTVDEAGEVADWIELYNPTSQPIPLGGYTLTDDLHQPHKCTLPASAVVPAQGYLVLWADGRPEAGPTHLNFRLAKDGGEVGLARPDGSWIDRIAYDAQEVDFSAARTPDGSDHWQILWHPTPGAANPAGDGQPVGPEVASEPPEQVPAAGDLSERILGYDVIPELALEVPPDSLAALAVDPRTAAPAYLVYDGRTYGPVGINIKGQETFMPFDQKPSLRIKVGKFAPGARFFGLKDLTLNNMASDFSMMHERLAYLIARTAGVPASRSNHALLTVNGQFYGLYANVETVRKRMIARWFDDASGPLHEAEDADFVGAQIAAGFDHKDGPDDRSLLMRLAQALTLPSADTAIAEAGRSANLAQFRRFWALCSVIAQFDSMPYSVPGDDYFAYADPTSGRLWFVPWGMDETFYSVQHDVLQIHSVLARRCMESPACFQDYVDQTWELQALLEQMDMLGERERVIAQIAPYVELDTRKPYTTGQVAASQQDLYWFFRERRRELERMLPPASQ
jgi:hypothetical protein